MLPRAAPALLMCTLATPNPSPKVETTYIGGGGEEDLASSSYPVERGIERSNSNTRIYMTKIVFCYSHTRNNSNTSYSVTLNCAK
jgi:hypothetical protein